MTETEAIKLYSSEMDLFPWGHFGETICEITNNSGQVIPKGSPVIISEVNEQYYLTIIYMDITVTNVYPTKIKLTWELIETKNSEGLTVTKVVPLKSN